MVYRAYIYAPNLLILRELPTTAVYRVRIDRGRGVGYTITRLPIGRLERPGHRANAEGCDGGSSGDQRVRAHRAQHHARGAGRRRHRLRGRQRPDRREDAGAPAEVRLGARQPQRRHRRPRPTASWSTATSSRCCRSKDPAALPWKDLGVDVVFESHRQVHRPRRRGQAPRRRREEGDHHRPGEEARRHRGARRQRRQVRPEDPPHHLQRVVHHQLPGAGGARCCTRASASAAAG